MPDISPVENFSHQITLFTAIAMAHVIRCLQANGLLDELAKRSINGQFAMLHEAATESGVPDLELWIDQTLVRALPPMPIR